MELGLNLLCAVAAIEADLLRSVYLDCAVSSGLYWFRVGDVGWWLFGATLTLGFSTRLYLFYTEANCFVFP